ncbi:hypothetical protein [Alkalibacillus haloalkaliphilus]|uniref:hypothetical protein n=1 Tax=Alkalibacillus haloalkaliphilus TaxID=94136 RepID=UPI002936CB6C|nr:hypothetical protein [Alkalibacillus haloalkaliphilus]MDV2581690.1 hypothetical protein [Alkalibacillus haloalkaliphilus]
MNKSVVKGYMKRLNLIFESIKSLNGGEFLDIHKKVLYLNLLDTMSKGVYEKEINSSGLRFKTFVTQFSDWDDSNRVSIAQLKLFIEKHGLSSSKLNEIVYKYIPKYSECKPTLFNNDPIIDELEGICRTERLFKKVTLNDFTHVSLLWSFRCELVHESRGRGGDELFERMTSPHYIHYFEHNAQKEEYYHWWEILYPLSFFEALIENSFSNIEVYFLKNDINPFDNYNFEKLWID